MRKDVLARLDAECRDAESEDVAKVFHVNHYYELTVATYNQYTLVLLRKQSFRLQDGSLGLFRWSKGYVTVTSGGFGITGNRTN